MFKTKRRLENLERNVDWLSGDLQKLADARYNAAETAKVLGALLQHFGLDVVHYPAGTNVVKKKEAK